MEQLPPNVYAQDQRPSLYAAVTIMRLLAVIAVILRIVARHVGGNKLWWDDWTIIVLTFTITLPETALEYATIVMGCGLHLPRVLTESPQNMAPLLKVIYADTLTYPLIITLVKTSFLMLYIRLFGVIRRFTIWCYSLLAVSIIWGLITFFLFVFQCSTIDSGWSTMRQGCIRFASLFIGTNVPNVVIDFLILGTPVPVVWNLKVPMAKKLVITGILAIGTIEVILSIIRVSKLGVLTFQDSTWDNAPALLWSSVECNVGTICCCLPVYGPLLPQSLRDQMAKRSTRKGERYYSLSYVQPCANQPPSVRNQPAGAQTFHRPHPGDWKDIRKTTDIRTDIEAADSRESCNYNEAKPGRPMPFGHADW